MARSLSIQRSSLLSDSQINSAFDFFGSTATGFGALAQKFSEITDPATGLIKLQQTARGSRQRIQINISDVNDRIGALQIRCHRNYRSPTRSSPAKRAADRAEGDIGRP